MDDPLMYVLANAPNAIGFIICIYIQTRQIDKMNDLINLLIQKQNFTDSSQSVNL